MDIWIIFAEFSFFFAHFQNYFAEFFVYFADFYVNFADFLVFFAKPLNATKKLPGHKNQATFIIYSFFP